MSSILGKAWLPAIAVLAVFAMFAFGNSVPTAEAAIDEVLLVDLDNEELYDNDGDGCFEAGEFITSGESAPVNLSSGAEVIDDGVVKAKVGGLVPFCVQLTEGYDTVNAQVTDGILANAICGNQDEDDQFYEYLGTWGDDSCEDQDGQGTMDLTVYCEDATEPASFCFESPMDDSSEPTLVESGILFLYYCPDEAAAVNVHITHDNDEASFTILCFAEPDAVTVTASPTTVEIIPQIGSYSHSEITIVISGDDAPVDIDDTEIDISVPKCAIEIGYDDPDSSPLAENWWTDDDIDVSYPTSGPNVDKTVVSNIWFHADWNSCTPGDVVVTVVVEVEGGADIVRNVTIKVVGPPAFITATAAPDKLICGEKSTITVKVTDAIGQNVSNNTQVELISNWGSVIAGTGATLGFPGTGPVNPLASSAAATYNGVAVAYLLTSNNHVGPYEVVAAAGGTLAFPSPYAPAGDTNDPYYNEGSVGNIHDHNDSLYSSAPITTQVTVTCSLPAAPVAPTVTAPATGTGSITPPNTGDAGLASSSSNGMLFVMIGAVAFVLAGIASVSYARR